ncbi:hypothetical protein [Clostridium novyi]|uniref:hypothetical protein n=1 Tax=Clostridium novyi TaxID=1542 RepID=UPI0016511436|nr:hypothetical protein [Clostridium novyi]
MKYNEFVNDEIMSDKDKRIYYLNHGICCIAYTLIKIIDGKRYISKLSRLNF